MGDSSSEGSLSLSGDGRYLIVGGYDTDAGHGDPADSTHHRLASTRASPAVIDTTTQVPARRSFNGNNIRGATSQDGTTGFWASGASNGGGATGGVCWIPFGGAETRCGSVRPRPTCAGRIVFGGQLYVSTIVRHGPSPRSRSAPACRPPPARASAR